MAFKKMDNEGNLPGPRALFYSGFDGETEKILKNFLSDHGMADISIFPCREDSLDRKVSDVLNGISESGYVDAEKLPQVMLLSGIQFSEVDNFLQNYVKTGLTRPIFATTTASNLDFTVKELLRHLLGEQNSMKEAMAKQ